MRSEPGSWEDLIDWAERAARGDADCRVVLQEQGRSIVRGLAGQAPPRDIRRFAYAVPLLQSLDVPEDVVRSCSLRLAAWARSDSAPGKEARSLLRNQVAMLLADQGYLHVASVLLWLVRLDDSGDSPRLARTLANQAAVAMRLGDVRAAAALAVRARKVQQAVQKATGPAGTADDRAASLETRVVVLSVLAEEAQRSGDLTTGERLADDLADACRGLVGVLGGEHPSCLSALTTLATVEFRLASREDSVARMERAAAVVAVAAQKSAATLGRGHPQARAALVALAGMEAETASRSGEEARLRRAAELVDFAAARGTAPAPALWFTLLGPVGIRCGGVRLPAGSPQQRALLTALLLRHGESLAAGELIDAMWGELVPPHAPAALRTYAARLRRSLWDAGRPDVLFAESGGYALRLSPGDEVDADLAGRLTREAEDEARAGRSARAHELAASALALWEGEVALEGVPGPAASAARDRFAAWRLSLRERQRPPAPDPGRSWRPSRWRLAEAAHSSLRRLRRGAGGDGSAVWAPAGAAYGGRSVHKLTVANDQVRRLRSVYLRWAELYLGSRSEAESVTDHVLDQLLTERTGAEELEHPAADAWKALRHRAAAVARARGRRLLPADPAASQIQALHDAVDPLGDTWDGAALLRALGELPERQHDVLVLRYCLGYGTEETADALGIGEAAVRSAARSARLRLRERLRTD
ncbi:sigma factor-like helix-turn-helix DNA-binding protein [Streptomyces sp. MP131-18]|uniref:sigma factor-like helix-turn-helix DNA-binding protein n=1 Tax=Streptomyces sp. MP131-18 TaxID=1857892 RepID=UPI00097C1F82|nr:sigma factor-like helix-turn-helix DNA-binding protein [Streptomyces sp. MP131-18]ONK12591.1 Regulatory protein AfsR [Streptomyces sp. MP131-18]